MAPLQACCDAALLLTLLLATLAHHNAHAPPRWTVPADDARARLAECLSKRRVADGGETVDGASCLKLGSPLLMLLALGGAGAA